MNVEWTVSKWKVSLPDCFIPIRPPRINLSAVDLEYGRRAEPFFSRDEWKLC